MDQTQNKSFFFKRYWWIFVLLLIIIGWLMLKGFSKDHDTSQPDKKTYQQENLEEDIKSEEKKNVGDFTSTGETKSFTDIQLSAANVALESGIKMDDPENDWLKIAKGTTQSDGKEDNPEPYPLGWTDLKNLNIGADENFLYIKFSFWDRIPDRAFSYNGDKMDGGSAKINYFTFTNSAGKKDWADLTTPISLREQSNGKLMPGAIMAMISPKGEDTNRKTLFTTYSKDGLFAGGPGENYLLSAFPLNQFNLKLGDKVTFDCSVEISSEKYHHEAIDHLFERNGSKFADTIEYVLGGSTYKVMPQVDEQNHS